MTSEGFVVGMIFTLLGIGLNIASPVLNPILDQNLGLWGAFLLLLGVVIIAAQLRTRR